MQWLARYRFLLISGVVAIVLLPHAAMAASTSFFGPIVPDACNCGNGAGLGCLMVVIQDLISFAITIAVFIAVAVIAYAGFLFVTNPLQAENRSTARNMLKDAGIGLVIALAAYLIVNTLFTTLTNTNVSDATSFIGISAPNCLPTATDIASSGGYTGGPIGVVSPTCPSGTTCSAKGQCLPPADPNNPNPAPVTCGSTTCPANNVCDSTTNPATPTCVAPQACIPPGKTGASGMNISGAVAYVAANAKPVYTGYCARAVCAAINNGGGLHMGCANASDLGGNLTGAGFTPVYTGTYAAGSSEGAFAYQAGDVVVFQPVSCGTKGHPNGHTAMYTGSQWVSDKAQGAQMASNRADYTNCHASFTIYRP